VPNLRIRDAGREYTHQIEGDTATLGRGDTNDIDIEDAKASKEHCRIERVGQRWKLVDLESKNGTKVNGDFKNRAWLGHGDVVQIGTAEMRFGLEGASRPASAAKVAAAPPGRKARPSAADTIGDEGEEEELPPPRYRRKSNTWLFISLGPVAILLIILLSSLGGEDSNNVVVRKRGDELAEKGQWDEAIRYMEQYGEPDQGDYTIVERRIQELREGKAARDKNIREQEAKDIYVKAQLLILSYNRGHGHVSSPDKILPLMKQLREKYADTETAEGARKEYPAWYAGRVPEPATEVLGSGGKLRKDWDAAVERSKTFRKEYMFREAQETIARFVTDREQVLGAGDLATYEQLRDEEMATIESIAESVYRARVSEAERLLKNKRYDDAIAAYKVVVEKFGLDAYVRKAEAEIAKIQKLKPGG
jgi:hypothetical protein